VKKHLQNLDGTPVFTEKEQAYLAELHRMERENIAFSHALMCKKFKWRSVAASHDFMTRLIEKGAIGKGRRLAFVESPLVTDTGRKLIGEPSRLEAAA
jgi:hypothetical protein